MVCTWEARRQARGYEPREVLSSQTQGEKRLSHADAHTILDRVREGQNYPEHVITMALRLTGDLEDE